MSRRLSTDRTIGGSAASWRYGITSIRSGSPSARRADATAALFAGGDRAEREQLGAILGEVDLAGLHGHRGQIAETGGALVLVADDAIDVDPAVGHAPACSSAN